MKTFGPMFEPMVQELLSIAKEILIKSNLFFKRKLGYILILFDELLL
jgi:hypothetical protein